MGPNRAHLDGVFDSRNNNKWKENGTLNSENINWIELTYSIEIICIVLDGIDLVAIFSWILLILDSVSFYDFFLKVVRQADRQKSRQIFYYSTCHQRKYPSIFTDCFFLLSWRLSLDIRSGIWTFIISIFNCSKIPIQDFFEMFLFRSCSKMKFISSDFRPFSRRKLEKNISSRFHNFYAHLFLCGSEFRCIILFLSAGVNGSSPNAVSEFRLGNLTSFSTFSFDVPFPTGLVLFNLPTSSEEFGLTLGARRTAIRLKTSLCITWVAKDLIEGSAPQSERFWHIVDWPPPEELLNVKIFGFSNGNTNHIETGFKRFLISSKVMSKLTISIFKNRYMQIKNPIIPASESFSGNN